MNKLKIYLGDLNYSDPNSEVTMIPLNVGYIAAYLKKLFSGVSVEIFKDIKELLDYTKREPPQILGLSHYFWNSNLDSAVLHQIKKIDHNILTVLGGINFQEDNRPWIKKFFRERPNVDLYLTGEGESSLACLTKLFIAYSYKFKEIPLSEWPANFFAYDHTYKKIINNPTNKLSPLALSEIPSPYLSGILDKFLNNPIYAPAIETNRGCPFSCMYCCWGTGAHSKIRFFPMERVIKEIEYIVRHSKNRGGYLYICDANFGLVPRDHEISKMLRQFSESYDFPKQIYLYFAKNSTMRVVDICDNIKNLTSVSMSMQSLNPTVLENIRRHNIPLSQYQDLHKECKRRGIVTFCELIYGLPGESYESFMEGAVKIAETGQPLITYPHLLLNGAAMSSSEIRKKYNMKTAFRIANRYISSFNCVHSVEYEEIVISTKDMTYNDFLKIRQFQFILFILRQPTFEELHHFLELNTLNYAYLARFIIENKQNKTWNNFLRDYKNDAKKEMIPKKEVKLTFTAKDIKKIKKQSTLLDIHYTAKLLSFNHLVNAFRQCIEQFFLDKGINDIKLIINFCFDKLVRYNELLGRKVKSYEYDIERWLHDNRPLKEFKLKMPETHEFKIDRTILHLLKKEMKVNSIEKAVCNIRSSRIRFTGDKIFYYQRKKMSK